MGSVLDMKYTHEPSSIKYKLLRGALFLQSISMFLNRVSILILLFQILILVVTSKKRDIEEEAWNMNMHVKDSKSINLQNFILGTVKE